MTVFNLDDRLTLAKRIDELSPTATARWGRMDFAQMLAHLTDGVRMALKTTHNLPEGAGSASIAAAYKLRHTLAEQRVVCIMSGGNIDAAKLKWILAT